MLPELGRGRQMTERIAKDDNTARKTVVAAAQRMSALGLSPGRSGNVSVRTADGLLITPSGVAYDTLTSKSIVRVAADGSVPPRQLKPSSETPFHRAIYASRPDVGAIVHCHSMNATVLACAHRPIPAFHYMIAAAGGADIPCVPYATFGSQELSRHVAAGLAARNACLMANHGAIAVGSTVDEALELAETVELLATQYVALLSVGGPMHILDADEMARVIAKFRNYGQRAQSS